MDVNGEVKLFVKIQKNIYLFFFFWGGGLGGRVRLDVNGETEK